MYTCLTNAEIYYLNNWDEYKKRNRPIFMVANEIPNIIVIHKTISEPNESNISISEALSKTVQTLQMPPYLTDRFLKEILLISSEDLIKEVDLFQTFIDSASVEIKWEKYANFSGNSCVQMFRIGPDFIDVVFSTSPAYYYRYSYKTTSIIVTETFKWYAKQGTGLGTHTRKMKHGTFEKCLI